ncbi:unnamed protein product [Prunus brigantina]
MMSISFSPPFAFYFLLGIKLNQSIINHRGLVHLRVSQVDNAAKTILVQLNQHNNSN